ncbi:tetratricopeptide repeat protein [Streptomyces sp. NPDC052000]|uniref:tetratricopeptide repeat protein n=1 Tax=Streptomyces sp. NPDC052000 TaxID=3155676 RepID=UPI00344E774C
MDCYRLVGEDKLARTLAEEVLRVGTDFDGTDRSPMRNAEARVTLGVTAAREGDLEQALTMGERALEGDRKSVPSLIMTSRELAAEMRRRYGSEPGAQESRDFMRSRNRSLDSFPDKRESLRIGCPVPQAQPFHQDLPA